MSFDPASRRRGPPPLEALRQENAILWSHGGHAEVTRRRGGRRRSGTRGQRHGRPRWSCTACHRSPWSRSVSGQRSNERAQGPASEPNGRARAERVCCLQRTRRSLGTSSGSHLRTNTALSRCAPRAAPEESCAPERAAEAPLAGIRHAARINPRGGLTFAPKVNRGVGLRS